MTSERDPTELMTPRTKAIWQPRQDGARLKDIAAEYGLTVERIKQICRRGDEIATRLATQ